ncbi:MAG: EAL domain-containing protein [Pseudomonadota bacterium]|nr:EAL domain-containing protein [Pseudomonadota bacterium]
MTSLIDKPAELRKQAEERLRDLGKKLEVETPPEKLWGLIHELQVHQIELEIQNEELRRTQRESETEKIRYSSLFDYAPIGYFTLDSRGTIVHVNFSAAELLGKDRQSLTGTQFHQLVSREHQERFAALFKETFQRHGRFTSEIQLVKPNGTTVFTRMESGVRKNAEDKSGYCLVTVNDISREKRREEQIVWRAYFDALTQLPNRMLLMDRLYQATRTAHRENYPLALLYIDLDSFKSVNDSHGHTAGDALLVEVAKRLKSCARESDTVARLGGDEFCMILPHITGKSGAKKVAEKILEKLSHPVKSADGVDISTKGSVGIAYYPDDASDPESLLTNADLAMYEAKHRGRNTYCIYRKDTNSGFRKRKLPELRRALNKGELELWYQPIINTETGSVESAEALLRWRHPDRGLVLPNEFIPVVENTELIKDIGSWVLGQVVGMANTLRDGLPSPTRLWMNVSCHQVQDAGYFEKFKQTLNEAVVDGTVPYIGLEITASAALDLSEDTIDMLKRINGMGVSLALDDFGTGHSSLVRLRHLAVEEVKIDRRFLQHIISDPTNANLTRAIIAFAHTLNIRVVAVGVEDVEHLDFLRRCRCDLVQGHYLSEPLTAPAFERFLRVR